MTTGIVLGTEASIEEVYQIAKEVGFVEGKIKGVLDHKTVADLALGIESKSNYFINFPHIATQMAFDDYTNRFPDNNPAAVQVLRKMYELLPNLLYNEAYRAIAGLEPVGELSQLLDSLEC